MNSARALLQFDFDADAFARWAPRSIPISPEIKSDLERIHREHGDGFIVPEREDLRKIYDVFFNAIRTRSLYAEFNSPKRIGRLARALTYSEDNLPRIVDTPELRDALELIEDHFRVSVLIDVFRALLEAWDAWGVGLLRAFVKKHLETYDGCRSFVQKLRSNVRWYCEDNGTTRLAMNLLRDQVKLSNVWSYLNLQDHTQTQGYGYFGAVGEAYVALNRRLDRESVADIVKFVEMHRDDRTNRTIVSGIIEKFGIDAPETSRQPVQSYALRNWKDPRIAGGDVRWREISVEARRIFTRWITKEDLRFFFDVVAQACNDDKFAYRKAFWLAYLGRIDSCRIVLHGNAEYIFRNNRYYQEQKRSIARLRGASSDQHAFIIQMGGHTFVEFSTTGACYVYDNARRPFRMGDSDYHMSELRNKLSAEHRVIHFKSENYYWQANLALWIDSTLGIAQVHSYQLEG